MLVGITPPWLVGDGYVEWRARIRGFVDRTLAGAERESDGRHADGLIGATLVVLDVDR